MNYDDTAKFGLQGSKRKSVNGQALDNSNEGEKKSATRPIVRITSRRLRLLDEDNLAGGCKALLDSLRYAGLILSDSPKEIQLVISQEKVLHREDEKTLVEIEYA